MQTVLELVKPRPEAKWVVFYSFAVSPEGGLYYDAQPIEQMSYALTMLAYDMNGEPHSFGHGSPLRLRNETQLGFKMVKWIKGIEFVEDFSEVGSGLGGYNNDHESSATTNPSEPVDRRCAGSRGSCEHTARSWRFNRVRVWLFLECYPS